MKVTLVDVQSPEELFQLLNTFEGPAVCCGVDLRSNPEFQSLIRGLAVPGRGIPQLEFSVSKASDLTRILRYMREGFQAAA